jgi:hypothetical protein
MNAVASTKAGLASGLLSMSRMVGGTFGVAVLGAIFQSLGHSSLESSLSGLDLPASEIDAITDQLGSGGIDKTLAALPAGQTDQVAAAAKEAFVSSLATSIGISAAVAAAGAVLAFAMLRSKPQHADGAVDDGPAEDAIPAGDSQPATPELAGSPR